ncbi:AtpZ/AtpI family protein [Aquimarina sp. BL5]|uniref:AtpZ/AtpI family protein n=1 Tax=Aquimarina sp. BL5 TaxID=1714860 RepID=UPI000E4D831A|nr:AtpZ/AtpI family protein [Aquimarina sp. BL5]AXT51928.1 AtpZ/AtpI family protein [Aquimarina sp. BL5]RKM93416.1 AtpZ/AtpI family protein [Aquimarina sp. BL5]
MKDEKNQKNKDNRLSSFARFTGMAFQMAAVIGIGVFIGLSLDSQYPNKYRAYTIVFSLLFVCLSMYQAIRQLNKNNNKE